MRQPRTAKESGGAKLPPAPSAFERPDPAAVALALADQDMAQLRLQWRNHLGGTAPVHLRKWLLMRLLAYRIQAAAFDGLDS